MITQRLLRIGWLLMLGCVVVGSLLPSTSAPIRALDELKVDDKALHLLAYLMLALLPALHETRRTSTLLTVNVAFLGVLLECGQRHIIGRSFDLWDMAANTAGLLGGLAAARLFRPRLAALDWNTSNRLQADLIHREGS